MTKVCCLTPLEAGLHERHGWVEGGRKTAAGAWPASQIQERNSCAASARSSDWVCHERNRLTKRTTRDGGTGEERRETNELLELLVLSRVMRGE